MLDDEANHQFGGVVQATMLLDANGVITYLDRNIAKVFDYTAQELIGMKFALLLAPPYDAHYAQLLTNLAVMQSQKTLSSTVINYSTPSSRLVEARTKHGNAFVVAVHLSHIVEHNSVVFVVAVERAKQPVGVLTAVKGVVLSCNAECERIFGYLPGELQGQRVSSLVAATADLQRLRLERSANAAAAGSNGSALLQTTTTLQESSSDEDELTLYVDFLQPVQSRKRSGGDVEAVNLVAGTPVPASSVTSSAANVERSDEENDVDDDADDDQVEDDEANNDAGHAVTKTSSSTAIGQTFRAVELETQCVDKLGRQFSARVRLQRKRMGVVELFRGFIQPLDGGDMSVLLITDADGRILTVSQMFCKAMFGYLPQELVQMNINQVLTGLPTAPLATAQGTAAAHKPTVVVQDDDSVSVAAPGVKNVRPMQGASDEALADSYNDADSESLTTSSNQLETLLRESATISSSPSPPTTTVSDDESEGDSTASGADAPFTDESDGSDGEADAPTAASPPRSMVKRARAHHGGAVYVRRDLAAHHRRTPSDVSPNFALTVGRRTKARHKSGAEVTLQMDVMRFQTRDGQVRFSVRLYSLMAVEQAAPAPPPPQSSTASMAAQQSQSAAQFRNHPQQQPQQQQQQQQQQTQQQQQQQQQEPSIRRRTSGSLGKSSATAETAAQPGAQTTPQSAAVRHVPFVGDWMLSRELGRGSFATVRLGTHVQSGQQCAIKLFLLEHGTDEECAQVRLRALREVSVLELVRGHPNVVNLYDVIDGEAAGGGTALVLEFVAGGELFKEIVSRGGLREDDARTLFVQLADALRHCHHNGVAHRDLKHQNILTDGHGRVLLIDFGLAISVQRCVDARDLQMGVGTPAYAAPEMLRGTVTNPMASDIWSLGIVLYSMVVADFPFRNVAEVLNGQFQPSRAPQLSPSLLDLLSRMLVHEPAQRLTIDDVASHPWLAQQ